MTVLEFAVENGYEGAEFLKKWNGYNCYEPYFEKDRVAFVGQPCFIMEKDGELRMSTPEEAMEILNIQI